MSTALHWRHPGEFVLSQTKSTQKRGRPLKFGEELIRREFRLPTTLSGDLNRFSIGKNEDVSDTVRDALRVYLGQGETPQEKTEAVKEALRAVLEEQQTGQLSLQFDEIQKEQLEYAAHRLGFIEPTGLLKSLALKVISDPSAAQEFLFGATERAFASSAQAELAERRAATSKKAPRKAAA